MIVHKLAQIVKSSSPNWVYQLAHQIYFDFIFCLGPNFAIWRLQKASKNPVTHLQKVRHKIAFDRDPILTVLCDKIKVRELVAKVIGQKYLPAVYFSGYDIDEIDWQTLPREFVCKVNHGAGGVIVVREGANPAVRIPVDVTALGWTHLEIHPDNADPVAMELLLAHWLRLDYWWKKNNLVPEWAYKNIKRGVIIEELLKVDNELPSDYKFYVVHGEVKLIRVLTERFTNSRGLYEYDRDWNFLGSTRWDNKWKRLSGTPPEIPNYGNVSPAVADELIRVAEALGVATDALRVDLYAVGDRVIFGETTIYPNAGHDFFTHEWIDKELGKNWRQNY